MLNRVNFKNKRAGRPTRAPFYMRWARQLRRKRVAYARTGAAHALKVAQQEICRFHELAQAYDVPVERTGPLPLLAGLPTQEWVEWRRSIGELRPVVKPPADAIRAREATT